MGRLCLYDLMSWLLFAVSILIGVEIGRCAQAIYGYTVDKNIGFATIRAGIPEGTSVTVGPNGSPATVVGKKFC